MVVVVLFLNLSGQFVRQEPGPTDKEETINPDWTLNSTSTGQSMTSSIHSTFIDQINQSMGADCVLSHLKFCLSGFLEAAGYSRIEHVIPTACYKQLLCK